MDREKDFMFTHLKWLTSFELENEMNSGGKFHFRKLEGKYIHEGKVVFVIMNSAFA